MSTPPVVSVLIIAWNSKRYLSRCMDALLTQTNQDFEIIMIDNGSTDEGVLGLQGKYPDLKLNH